MNHMRFADCDAETQHEAFLDIIWKDPLLRETIQRAEILALPNWRIVSGALYNTIWNRLTDRPSGYGIKDIDLFYFDGDDLSYDAEDRIIKQAHLLFSDLPIPVEIRNQARVHLWFESHFGQSYAPLNSTEEGIDRFASKTHGVGISRRDGELDLYAPFGLAAIFQFRIVPNPIINNQETHLRKGQRAVKTWPELTVEPWPEAH